MADLLVIKNEKFKIRHLHVTFPPSLLTETFTR